MRARDIIPLATDRRIGNNPAPDGLGQVMDKDKFVERLRATIDADPALTPAGLSKKAGLDNSTIRKLLDGSRRHPSVSTAEKICQALGTTLSDFMSDEGQKELDEIAELYSRLSPDEQQILLATARRFAGKE